MDNYGILHLFEKALEHDIACYNIPEDAIRIGIESMAHVYKPDTINLKAETNLVADYNDAAHRCAYLHKYAMFHTAMVQDMLCEVIRTNYALFNHLCFSRHYFGICSLGGGPGTDVIGAMAAFHNSYPYFNIRATVVDYMFNWSYSFETILNELRSGYGSFGSRSRHLDWRYIGANLLKSLQPDVSEALSCASLVTMIKFSSAAACQGTKKMMKNIFSAMRPGSVVLFIDNDGGGFHNIFMKAADELNLISIHGPFRHLNYCNESLRLKKFGFYSCFKTVVTVHALQKPLDIIPYPHPYPHYSPRAEYPNRRVSLDSSPLAPSPPTPMVCRLDFTNNECVNSPDFVYSQELPLSSYITTVFDNPVNSPLTSTPPIFTPHRKLRERRKKHQGCLPLKHWRNHIAAKVNNFKSRARSIFRKKQNKKNHPIFKI